MKGFWFQINIGMFLSLGVGFGLLQRNWSTFLGFFYVALFIAVLYLVSHLSTSRNRFSRAFGKIMLWVYAAFFACVALLTVERLWLINGDSCPSFMGTVYQKFDIPTYEAIPDCSKGGGDWFEKSDKTVIRCGSNWLTGTTIILNQPSSELKDQTK
ncbi:hypothetical protein ACUNEV_25905 [Serratia sp. IR-2025]